MTPELPYEAGTVPLPRTRPSAKLAAVMGLEPVLLLETVLAWAARRSSRVLGGSVFA